MLHDPSADAGGPNIHDLLNGYESCDNEERTECGTIREEIRNSLEVKAYRDDSHHGFDILCKLIRLVNLERVA